MGRCSRPGNLSAIKSKAVEAAVSAANLGELQAARLPPQRPSCNSLVIDSFWLRFGKELLKTWIVTDWIPDGVDLQTRNRNVLSGRDCEQLPKNFYRLFGLASVRFDLGQSDKKIRCRGSHLFRLASNLPLLARREARRRYVRDKHKPKPISITMCGLLAARWAIWASSKARASSHSGFAAAF